MNTKIFSLLHKNLQIAFNLPKYAKITLDRDTVIEQLPWTPARWRKFREQVEGTLQLTSGWSGTLAEIVEDFDTRYLRRFFSEIWQPRTDDYKFSGWQLVEQIQRQGARRVLDVGCGYHPFRNRIPGIIGIDPYNDAADYMIDILDFNQHPGAWDAILCLGSINFNDIEEIEMRFAHCTRLLAPGGRMYFRANPGIQWKNGPWVEIFAWSFDVAADLASKYNLNLESFKQENTVPGRLFFEFSKPLD
jgi:SAM-dependent methyltransferase